MKKIIALAMAAMMLVAAMAVLPVSAAAGKGSYGEVPMYKGGITVDGKIDEAYTKLGLKLDASADYGDNYKTDTAATLYLLHDGQYLYIAYDVKSANPLGKYDETKANAANSYACTGTELYLDWGNKADNTSFAKFVGWFDGRYWAAGSIAGKDLEYVAEYKATADAEAKTYVLEWKLPFKGESKVGDEVGFYVMITSNSDMNAPKQDQICTLTPGLANKSAEFLNITLGLKEVKLPTAETTAQETTAQDTTAQDTTAETKAEEGTTDSAETFDPAVILAVAAAAAGAGVVVSKKRR